jgi:hypothetical protein
LGSIVTMVPLLKRVRPFFCLVIGQVLFRTLRIGRQPLSPG